MPNDNFADLKPSAPGAWRNGTRREAKGRWFEVNQVRWRNGRLRPVGGWQKFESTSLEDPPRGGHAWRDNAAARWLALGSASKLYAHDGGSLIDITPDGFTVGRVDSLFGLGYGASDYGEQAYGTERSSTGIVLDAATWTLDNFGETLVGVSTGDGLIYEWTPIQLEEVLPEDRLAFPVLNAPTMCSACFVTAERHLVALAADGNPRLVRWSSREDREEWTPGPLNTAGEFEVATPGRLLRGIRYRNESLLFTETDVHVMRFVGSPLVYGREQVGEANGLLGPLAVVSLQDQLVWMGVDSFWSYDGVVRQIASEVHDYVFNDINILQGAKVVGGHNPEFGEVWWFYASAGSVENDRYVIWSYREGWWSYGTLGRTTWVPKGAWPYSVGASPTGELFQHEQGWTANGASRVADIYAVTGALELGRGERFMEVVMLHPDEDENEPGSEANAQVSFLVKQTSQADPYRIAGPYVLASASGYVPARFTGRQVEMRVEPVADGLFTFGQLRAEVKPGSGR